MANAETEKNQPNQKGGSSADYQAMLDDAQGGVGETPSQETDSAQAETNPNELRARMDHALQKGGPDELKALLDSGVSPDQEDHEGRTALMLRASQGRKEDVEMLVARGANVNTVFLYHDRIPMTALDAARQTGHSEIADILIGLGAKTGKEIAQEQANSSQ